MCYSMGYKLKLTKDELYSKGFHYNKLMSDDVTDYYSLRFPVLKYKKMTTLECELTVELQTGAVVLNVFNYGTNDIYVPYYNNQYGQYETLDIINAAIKTQMKKFGAKETKK